MPQRSTITVNMTKGVYASASPFALPKGFLLRMSNLVLTERGAIKVTDGSHVISSGIANRIAAIARFNPTGGSAVLMALAVDASGNVQLWNINGATAAAILTAAIAGASQVPGMTQMLGSMMLALGNGVPLQVYTSGAAATPITNADFVGTNIYPPWSASSAYAPGSIVTGVSGGVGYLFETVNGGFSGSTAPAWPASFEATVVDNGVTWENVGPTAAPAPPGAAFAFYHLGFPWVWGTSPTYTATGIDGPDALRMGGLGQVNYWDPTFQAFIGQNDGQLPQGGSVFALSESGIPATGQLVLFKTKDTYQVINVFPNIAIVKVPTGVGCVAPGTIQFIPGMGIMRLSSYGVALFDGTNDNVDQFTDPIRPYLFGGASDITAIDWANIQNASSLQAVNPPGYLLLCPLVGSGGANTRGFFYDRFAQAWIVIDFPFGGGAGGFVTAEQQQSQSFIGGFSDGNVRQLFAGDTAWDTGAIAWSFRTPPLGAPGTTQFFRRAIVRNGGSKSPIVAATVTAQTIKGVRVTQPLRVPQIVPDASVSLDVGRTYLGGMYIDIEGSGPGTIQGLEIHAMPKAPSRVG